ncbi:hypothetical protein K2173_011375 [Erythroxylum novogranatense]|uniref:CSC1-like protein At3g54510 n=1 Tax=Erythroxylum novogranatense TaxID=1862640 RepID=A0AAV8S9M5_9ROSI|nr:hypothetical protein K2173_011375 [Erythroxylum novogranatense]
MTPESLIASAIVNFGLAFVILSLFSILKKQTSNAPIYYARRISKRQPIPLDHSSTLRRLLPSVSWIPRAFRVTEDEILETNGLDALLIIRLFKFGINCFGVCSLVGLVILLPINYGVQDDESPRVHHPMDPFTISNIERRSDRLWVHFACLWFISFYAMFLLYKEYKAILVKRVQQLRNLRHRPDQFTVLVRQIPSCLEHKRLGFSVDHFFSKYYPNSYLSHQVLYDAKDIENLSDQAKHIARRIEKFRERSRVKKQNKDCLLLRSCRDDYAKVVVFEEKLVEFSHKILRLQGEDMLKQKELPVSFVSFKSICSAALAAQSQQYSNPLLWITQMAPEIRDVSWKSLAVPLKLSLLYKITEIVLASLLLIFFAVPVTAVQGIAKYEKLRRWFPPAIAVELIPGLSSIITGYLPSAVLKGFIYVVPFAMLGMAKIGGGSISKSKEEMKACDMVFYFLVGNVFFLSLLSGSLLDEIRESFSHPKNFPSHLASAVSAQADFFMTYIMNDGLSGFSFQILQPGDEENPYLFALPYFRFIRFVSLSILIGMVYAIVAPLLLPVLIGYFCLGCIVYVNKFYYLEKVSNELPLLAYRLFSEVILFVNYLLQIEDVYETIYETCGRYWPYIHQYIFVGIILMQITMIGLFGLKSKPTASIATIPLLLLTTMFNQYCKIRFLPTFRCYPIQDAAENDELDRKLGRLCLVNFVKWDSSLSQPLVASL